MGSGCGPGIQRTERLHFRHQALHVLLSGLRRWRWRGGGKVTFLWGGRKSLSQCRNFPWFKEIILHTIVMHMLPGQSARECFGTTSRSSSDRSYCHCALFPPQALRKVFPPSESWEGRRLADQAERENLEFHAGLGEHNHTYMVGETDMPNIYINLET